MFKLTVIIITFWRILELIKNYRNIINPYTVINGNSSGLKGPKPYIYLP